MACRPYVLFLNRTHSRRIPNVASLAAVATQIVRKMYSAPDFEVVGAAPTICIGNDNLMSEIVVLEEMALPEQLHRLRKASVLVASHGQVIFE